MHGINAAYYFSIEEIRTKWKVSKKNILIKPSTLIASLVLKLHLKCKKLDMNARKW